MLDTSDGLARYDDVWREAEPYLRARKNDIHIPLSFAWCQRLLEAYPDADRDICSLAILLHDIGWYAIDMETIVAEGFRSENFLQSDVRYRHEQEGVRLANDVLANTGWNETVIAAVCEIIDGHDTRPHPHHLDDRVVRDADKLWRFEVAGVSTSADWFGVTPHVIVDRLETLIPKLETEAAQDMARSELAATRGRLMLHLI
ncbi:metal-dependent phosphohydrolase [Zhengella mangrovi]|uniref:Metal-dependent phosphohydrolase n=1 Tax=Zhengella mangrovi TaxID=1982044 RepID=A0A2G1QR44_9HYPH|nr:HD domain-containing protein [Zhengella mangrovi]PHP67924.1 metal-dependent phosphohydrolase [Zhengella mangrovi]